MVNLGRPVYITVRAVTNQIGNDIRRGLRGAQGDVSRAGEDMGKAFTSGFNRGVDTNVFRRVANGIRTMVPEADAARAAFQTMVRTGYTLGTALVGVVGAISSVISGLVALAGAAGGAVTTVSVLGNVMFALGAGMIASRLALSGVGGALQKLNQQSRATAVTSGRTAVQAVRDSQARESATQRIEDAERSLARTIEANRDRIVDANNAVRDAQLALNDAIRAGREEIQQIGFDAEDAAINEQKAALDLEKARLTLAKVQDLPPNNRARREAELAFAEAELNYRKAKDANADLAREQDRLAKTGVNGLDSVIDARDRLAKAEADKAKTVKDALRDEEDALRNVADARKNAQNVADRQGAAAIPGASVSGGGGAPWDEGLNDAQRRFVLFLNSLRPKFEELKRIAAEAFLPRLQTAIENLANRAYPTIARGIGLVAAAMGDAAITLSEYITSGRNLEKLNAMFETSAPLIRTLGSIFGRLYDILLSIFVATAPMAQRFFDFINGSLGQFADYLNSFEGNASLVTFFGKAEAVAVQFGSIFGNIFRGIGAVIDANLGPGTGGDIMLQWLEKATADWGTKGGSLITFFQNVATNATAVLTTLGDLVAILGRVGENQNIGKAFETLLEGGPALENILQKTADAAPMLAELIVTITQIVDALTDTGAIEAFLGTLNEIATWVREFVAQPAVKAFLDFFGRIFASMSAVGLVLGGVSFGLKVLLGVFAAMLGPVATVVGLISKFRAAMMLSTAATAASAAATGASTAANAANAAATTASAKATGMAIIKQKAAAAAQWLFNAAMNANPIMLVVTAIAALVAGLVWFFTQTELGKEIWANFTKFIAEAWANVSQFLTEAFTNVSNFLTETWTNISNFFSGLWNGIVAIFQGAVNWLLDMFLNWTIYGLIIQNWDTIVAFFQEVWNNIMGFFDAAFKWIDSYVLQPMIKAFQFVGFIFNEVGRFIGDVWRNIQNAINVVWQWIDRNIFAPIRLALNILQLAFTLAGAVIQKAWQDLQNALNAVWLWIDQNVFDPIKTAVGLVQKAFENVGAGIAKAWDGIKKAAAVPINFVIDTVYNNGLRSFWNDIADNLNMKNLKLPKAKTVAFAQGGVMPGYSPGRDIHKFYSPTGGWLHLSGGEAIMRPEWTRAVGGPAAVARMNRAARNGQAFASGGVYSAPRVQRFANGGTTNFAGDFLDGLGNIMSIIGDFFVNPIDAVQKHLINGLIKPLLDNGDDSLFGQLIGGIPIRIAEGIGNAFKSFFGGASGVQGTAGMGWRAMQALVEQSIPGARITSAYRPGSITVNGGKSYHGSGRAIDVVPATMDTFNRMLALFPNARELIYSPAGNRQLLNGKPHYWTGAVRATHWDHVHAAMANGGTVFPRTGGSIVQVAEAGRAERIEPLDENGISERDKAWAREFMGGAGGGVTINVYQLPNEDQQALAENISRILSSKMRRGGL
ncbi:tape measure protein [Microbacterium phage Pumpernickel]|uniref:Tape measure protein n=1 Tax=Microbacterium phage Pumpernickel TaxID=2885983 RepID=A0AAE8Y739_9CAUD|nr:tape measure protein [Microbacterium phage Pumpernickel]UDL15885.1 tape measure protein [Microbacterium phage Pumpernickel]